MSELGVDNRKSPSLAATYHCNHRIPRVYLDTGHSGLDIFVTAFAQNSNVYVTILPSVKGICDDVIENMYLTQEISSIFTSERGRFSSFATSML